MAAVEVIGTKAPHHFYREHQGLDTLSRKFQSSELFTPYQVPQRPTVSGIRYKHFRDELEKPPRMPWGMDREYGGEGPVNLPDDHRPKSEPPPEVGKGHRHFGSGIMPFPRGLPVEQYYDLTLLRKSNVRSNDQLLPKPTEVDMSKIQINREFPAEHPYSSHMSRFALFPSYSNTPDDYKTGDKAQQEQPLHPHIPRNPYGVTIVRQSKGCADRTEKQDLPLDTQNKALRWPGDNFFQQRKTPNSGRQQFYPVPPKAVLPNHAPRSLDHTINVRTANALRNVERAQWVTTYNKNYTGYGSAGALRLDNFDEKVEEERRGGIENHALKPRGYNTFMPPRPLEGRISRLIGPNQMVRCVIKDGRIQYVPYTPKITIEMDKVREHPNLPSETHEKFKDPAKMEEWKRQQAMQHPDYHIMRLKEKKAEIDDRNTLVLSGDTRKAAYDHDTKNYLKEMALIHRDELKKLTENSRWRQAELQKHHHDLTKLKRKVDYTTPLLQPPVYYDTLHKIYTVKPPFYYDGDNPYEYDYVSPWEMQKTAETTDYYEAEGGRLVQYKYPLRQKDWENYQFAGSPGKNPYIMPKYTEQQLLHNKPRVLIPAGQKPAGQSTFTFSYSPNQALTVKTQTDPAYDLTDLSKSLPVMFNSKTDSGYSSPKETGNQNSSVHFKIGGGDVTQDSHAASSNPNTTGAPGRPLYDPALLNPDSNPVVDTRHHNPEGTYDFRFRWTPSYPYSTKPQTELLNIQNSFTRSDARKVFHNSFPETNPDLRDNIGSGKKHDFFGQNAYYWH